MRFKSSFELRNICGEKVLIGLPGGVVFSEKTVFDILLPRILTDDRITKQEIIEMGHGGLLG